MRTTLADPRRWAQVCPAPVLDEDLETAVCWNIVVPATIRAHLAARELAEMTRRARSEIEAAK